MSSDRDEPIETALQCEDEIIVLTIPIIKKTVKLSQENLRLLLQLTPILAVLAAFAFSSVFLVFSGFNPIILYIEIFNGALGIPRRTSETITRAAPLIIGAIAICVAFKARSYNMGGVGQLFAGAIGATIIAAYIPGAITTPLSSHNQGIIPIFIHIPLMMSVAILLGAGVAFIPAILKTEFGANESVTSILMNYVVNAIAMFLLRVTLKAPDAEQPISLYFPASARLPRPFAFLGLQFDIGIIIAIIIAPLIYILLSKTRIGYQIRITGFNPKAAKASGLSTRKSIWIAMALSGGLFGLAGMITVSGSLGYMDVFFPTTTGVLGYSAISTALLANLSPLLSIVSGIFFAVLESGSTRIAYILGVPGSLSSILEGLILLFVLLSEVVRRRLRQHV